MKQITRDFLTIALLADPARNDMVERLELRLRSGTIVALRGLRRIKGGLDGAEDDAKQQDRIHMIDEEDIAAVMVTRSEAALVAGIQTFAEIQKHALTVLKMKASL